MLNSQVYTILSLLAGASVVNAHGYVYSWTIDGTERRGFNPDGQQGYEGAERPTDNYAGFKAGVNNGWGPALRDDGATLACGGTQAGSGLESWPVKAGSDIVIQWSGPKNGESVWPEAHLGPMLDYMAKCPGDTCDGVAADSLDWFKVKQETYDGNEWPSARITAGEDWTTTVPADIAPGAYLFRHEIISLHFEWSDKIDDDGLQNEGWQSYPYCFQATVESSGSAVPSDTMTFPDGYSTTNYEWYDYSTWDQRSSSDYVPPGPAVYSGGGSSGPATSATSSTSAVTSFIAPSASVSTSTPSEDDENTLPTEEQEEASAPTSDDDGTLEPVETDEESSASSTGVPDSGETTSATIAPENPTSVASDSASRSASQSASSRRTGGWWRTWRNTRSRTASVSAAQETETEGSGEDVRRRSVIKRYAPGRVAL